MSAIEKLKQELKSRPKTFKWSDLERILSNAGYLESKGGKTTGSRVRFTHPIAAPIILHKPHPSNQMKSYAIRFVADVLESEELL